jgi:hypothetical protein
MVADGYNTIMIPKVATQVTHLESAKRLQDELAEVINEGWTRFDEYVKSPRHMGYKTWDEFRAANPIFRPIKPAG